MKILVLPSWYPPQGGEFFRDYCEAFARKGCSVRVIALETIPLMSLKFSDFKKVWNISEHNENGVIVLRSAFLKLPKFERLNLKRWSKRLLHICDDILTKFDPDIIHIQSAMWAGLPCIKILDKKQVPVVITEHRSRFVYENKFASDALKDRDVSLLRKVFENRIHVVTVSRTLKQTIESRFNPFYNIEVIGNFTDINFFHPAPENKSNPFTFITIGNLEYYKGIDLLVEAFGKVHTKFPMARLIIAGKGNQKPLLRRCRVLQIDKNVKFLGEISRDEVLMNLQSSHAYVSASRYEAFGVAIIEAMACGLPVVATRSGGPEEIISGKHLGILADDFSYLSTAMERMIENFNDFDQATIRKYVIDNYSMEVITRKYMDFFKSISIENTLR